MQAIIRGAAGRDVLLTGRRMRCGAPVLMDPGYIAQQPRGGG